MQNTEFLAAKDTSPTGEAASKWSIQRKRKVAIIAAVVVAVIIAIGVAVGVVVNKRNDTPAALSINNGLTSGNSGNNTSGSKPPGAVPVDPARLATISGSQSTIVQSTISNTASLNSETISSIMSSASLSTVESAQQSATVSQLPLITTTAITSQVTTARADPIITTSVVNAPVAQPPPPSPPTSSIAPPTTQSQPPKQTTQADQPPTSPVPSTPQPQSFNYRPFTTPGLIGYWLAGSGSATQLDLSSFTALKYAFLFISPQAEIITGGSDDATLVPLLNGASVRGKYSSLRTVASIGGWTGGQHFSSVAANADLRLKFAKNVHAYLDGNGFDGVDLDWEFPYGGGLSCNEQGPEDVANFALLLAALRAELGPTRHISIAVGAAASRYSQGGRNYLGEYAKYVSYMGVMTYDLTGSWSPSSDFNSALGNPGGSDPQEPASNGGPNSIQSAIQGFLGQGVSSNQLVAGLAFYGRSWSVSSKGGNNGLFMACGNNPSGSGACPAIQGDYGDTGGCDTCGVCGGPGGTWRYNALRGGWGQQSHAPLADGPSSVANGWSYQYFGFAASATLFSPSHNGISNVFISYDDAKSIQAKASWMRGNVGGAMIWEMGSDYQGELTAAARAGWGG